MFDFSFRQGDGSVDNNQLINIMLNNNNSYDISNVDDVYGATIIILVLFSNIDYRFSLEIANTFNSSVKGTKEKGPTLSCVQPTASFNAWRNLFHPFSVCVTPRK